MSKIHQPSTFHNARLLWVRQQRIDRLRGFRKHHHVPQSAESRDQQFLFAITRDDLNDDLKLRHTQLRSAFGFKRRELTVTDPSEGFGVIETPFFNYEISVDTVDDQPEQMQTIAAITQIRDMEPICSEPFYRIFQGTFRTLEITPAEALDLEMIVDQIEDQNGNALSVDYDKDLTWCEISVSSLAVRIRLTPQMIRIISTSPIAPRQLFESCLQVQQAVLNQMDFNLDAWSDTAPDPAV